MKKIFLLTALAVLLGMATATAQQIAVVAEDGETTVFHTFPDAIEGARDGSVIYLPGGAFPLADSVKITKRLTIIGIGHKSNNDNVDGVTTISGNLWFNEGSSNSAIMGCYITGNVNIGEGGASVNNVMVKCCNLNSVQVANNTCNSVQIIQNYIRNNSRFNGASGNFKNNVLHSLHGVNGGNISNNIITSNAVYNQRWGTNGWLYDYSAIGADNSYIYGNILTNWSTGRLYDTPQSGSNCQVSNNMSNNNYGDNYINISGTDWNDIFVNYNNGAINPRSNFHFKEAYAQYEGRVGVYADGVDFDKQIAPVPYIVAKRIDEQTDASGHLGIKVRVKAGE